MAQDFHMKHNKFNYRKTKVLKLSTKVALAALISISKLSTADADDYTDQLMAETDFELSTRSRQVFAQSAERLSDDHERIPAEVARRICEGIEWERYEMDYLLPSMPPVSLVSDEAEKSTPLAHTVINFFSNLFYRA